LGGRMRMPRSRNTRPGSRTPGERSFPTSAEVRHVAIELLAERYAVEELGGDPRLIADAIVEAVEIRRARRS